MEVWGAERRKTRDSVVSEHTTRCFLLQNSTSSVLGDVPKGGRMQRTRKITDVSGTLFPAIFSLCCANIFSTCGVDPCRRYKQRTRRLDTGYVARSWMRVSISAS